MKTNILKLKLYEYDIQSAASILLRLRENTK